MELKTIADLILIIAGIAFAAFWLHALTTYNPDEIYCDMDCESCPFPSDGCSQKKNREDKHHERTHQ